MQEQMGNISKAMETLRKNRKGMLEIKNTVTEIKNAFDGRTHHQMGYGQGKNR